MSRLIRHFTVFVLVVFCVSACTNSSPTENPAADIGDNGVNVTLNFEQPGIIPKRIKLSENSGAQTPALELVVQLIRAPETQTVAARYNEATDSWLADVEVQPGSYTEFIVTWSDRFSNNQSLILAQAVKFLSVPFNTAELEVSFSDQDYYSAFDDDADRLSNLSETISGTDPFDAASPGDVIVEVDVEVELEIPSALIGTSNPAPLLPKATLDGANLNLSFNGNAWITTTTTVKNTDAFLSATFYAETKPNVVLASAKLRQNTGNGMKIYVPSSGYDVLLDDDGYGLTNVEEFNNGGTNPNDANDPPRDPCEISQFSIGCVIDTDGDGKADSNEGNNADVDSDGIPDYRESSVLDADGDGFSDEIDPANEDPCIPEANSLPCTTQ